MRPLSCTILLVVAATTVSFAHAGAEPSEVELDSALEMPSLAATCTLTPGPFASTAFIWTPPEELQSVAWRLPLGSCAACADSGGALSLSQVSFRMRWLKVCSAQVELSIIGALASDSCMVPDPSNVLCGPTTRTISGNGSISVTHTLPLPAGCCITGNAFLMVRFTGLGACASGGFSPGLAGAQAPCVNCDQFVTASNIFPSSTEWCSIGATRPMWFSIAADCCAGTAAGKRSWGNLKQLYR